MDPARDKIEVKVERLSSGCRLALSWREDDETRRHSERIAATTQQDYLDLFARLAPLLGTRMPLNRSALTLPRSHGLHRPLLTRNIAPQVLYGYGDPSVLWVGDRNVWYLVATSNGAPDAFPILRAPDLASWELTGFAFPREAKPAWADPGAEGDFWAPELHRVGSEFWLCFAAREHDGSMSIAIARSTHPDGPFEGAEWPLLQGGMIDAHLFVDGEGAPLLLWKGDSNGVWPRLLVEMIAADPGWTGRLFASAQDRRTAALTAALWQTARDWPPMEQFFVLQPLIEAVVERFGEVRALLRANAAPAAAAVDRAMDTPIYAQRLAPDGSALLGERQVVLVNDLAWEAHLIEGPWLTEQDGRFYLFYAGNDFSTHDYGIGVAVGDTPTGPFRKMAEPLLRSDEQWVAPGHPSVARGPDGLPQLFYHAYPRGKAGYNEFRALLTCRLRFHADGVKVIG